MKGRRILVLCLAVLVALSMTTASGFAASKKVVVTGEKYYIPVGDKMVLESSWKDTYKDGVKTKWNYKYNEVNRKTGKISSSSEEGEKYEYNSKGDLKIVYGFNNGKTTSKHIYSYKKGRLKKVTDYYYYDGKYNKDSVTTHKWASSTKEIVVYKDYVGDSTFTTVNYYNKNGTLKETKYYPGEDVDNLKSDLSRKYYYFKGIKKIKKEVEKSDSQKRTLEYNKNGEVTYEETTFTDNNDKWTITNTYDKYGRVIKTVQKDYKGKKVTRKESWTFKYKGKYNNDPKYPKQRLRYDSKGNLTRRIEYSYKKI